MHLVTLSREGETHIGALQQRDGRQTIVDLNRAEPRLPNDMIAFLQQFPEKLTNAIYMEGGPETSLYANIGGTKIETKLVRGRVAAENGRSIECYMEADNPALTKVTEQICRSLKGVSPSRASRRP